MSDNGEPRRDDTSNFGGAGGVRTPAPGESSSANHPAIRAASLSSYDDQTVLNIPAAEIFEAGSTSRPSTSSSAAGSQDTMFVGRPPSANASGDSSTQETMFGGAAAAAPHLSSSSAGNAWATPPPVSNTLPAGTVIGNRYEIVSLLGVGGMGAVYKTRDLEIGRLVAFKVIRPEFALDPAIIDRFKQELLLASQVTHKNVIRIYDLGEADGMKFITMEYVDGQDLHAIIREKGKFTKAQVIAIMRQVCQALEAAHHVGVVHRDLKPQNILMDANWRVLVMDFGLARTLEDNGMTQSGSLVGTMDYMSPEQALGKSVDQRSDIFAMGIIFYELLSGQMPYQAPTAVARLIMRTQQAVGSLAEIDPALPLPLCDIVARCMERDVALRYQGPAEILVDLDALEGGAPISRLYLPSITPQRKLSWKVVAPVSVLTVGLLTGGYFLVRGNLGGHSGAVTATTGSGVSLAVFPLRNASGDPGLDWMSTSVADMLGTAVGQSANLHTISSERLRQVYSDLRLTPQSTIDTAMLQRISGLVTADNVVSGQYVRLGDQINIEVVLQDLKNNSSTTLKAQSTEKDLPNAINTLAESVRKNLSLSSADLKSARARSFEPTSTSPIALRRYNEAIPLAHTGNNLQASKLLTTAVQEDPQFAQAFALLSQVQSELGFQAEAQQSSRRAVELAESQPLPSVVKDLINANHARITQANKKAIEAYEVLFRNLPGDTDVEYTLASLYIDTSAYDKARVLTTALLKDNPKNVRALWQMGVLELTSNNPQAALDPLNQAISITIQTNNLEMKALVELAIGITYRLLNKPEDALRNYQDSIAINEKLGQKRGIAAALAEMAQVQSSSGDPDGALASYKRSLQLLREIGMNKEVGDTLMDMGVLLHDRGKPDEALQAYQEALRTQRENGDENFEALCLNNIASVYLTRGDTGNAFTYFQQALQLREKLAVPGYIAESLSGMGEAYTRDGQYDEAIKVLIRALELARKSDNPQRAALISHQMGQVFADEGRYGAAVTSMQDSLKGLRALNDKTKDLVEVQNSLALTLARSGHLAEAATALEGTEAAAHDLKNDVLLAEILNTRGDIDFYKGDSKAAGQQYQKALPLASHGKEAGVVILSKLNLARVALTQGHARETIATLTPLVEKRATYDRILAIRISSTLSAALIQTKAPTTARQILLSDLGQAERAGMKPEIAGIYYLLGTAAKASKNTGDALSYSRQATKTYDAIRAEQGGDKILERADLKQMYQDATQTVSAGATTLTKP
jgi:tetratricopeptide (TPR) repeat protein/predicted Ser/Thr protein kinase